MLNAILVSLRASAVTLVVTGLLYPAIVTGAQALFPSKANGSIAHDNKGQEVGSDLIAQPFANLAYLASRPSAAGEKGYDPTSSSGSNLGPTSAKLRDRVQGDLERLAKDNPDATGPVPVELVTTSASGLDPEVSPEAALWQAPRIAKARGVSVETRGDRDSRTRTRARPLGLGRTEGQCPRSQPCTRPPVRLSPCPDCGHAGESLTLRRP